MVTGRHDWHAQPEVPFVAALPSADAREMVAVELDQRPMTPSRSSRRRTKPNRTSQFPPEPAIESNEPRTKNVGPTPRPGCAPDYPGLSVDDRRSDPQVDADLGEALELLRDPLTDREVVHAQVLDEQAGLLQEPTVLLLLHQLEHLGSRALQDEEARLLLVVAGHEEERLEVRQHLLGDLLLVVLRGLIEQFDRLGLATGHDGAEADDQPNVHDSSSIWHLPVRPGVPRHPLPAGNRTAVHRAPRTSPKAGPVDPSWPGPSSRTSRRGEIPFVSLD